MLSAGLWAALAMLVWLAILVLETATGTAVWVPFAPAPHLWHAHEMVFGYASAAMGGFFLTAVPNWTGAKAARHAFIATAATIWLAGRVALWFSAGLPPLVVAAVDLAFLPILGAKILTQLLQRPKPQNMMFMGILALIWLGNLMVHLDWAGLGGDAGTGLRLGLYATCALIAILGGRVTPAFTRNAMQREGRIEDLPRDRTPLAVASAVLPLALALSTAAQAVLPLPAALPGALALGAGLALLARQTGWQPRWTLGQPILWALHAGYAVLGLGYVLAGLSMFGLGPELAALHVLGIGAVGGMTLAVMSRATLGHGGRPLIAPRPVVWAYALVFLSAALRWAATGHESLWFPAILGAGLTWVLAFGLFVAGLWGAFWGARPDRAPPAPPPEAPRPPADRAARMSQPAV